MAVAVGVEVAERTATAGIEDPEVGGSTTAVAFAAGSTSVGAAEAWDGGPGGVATAAPAVAEAEADAAWGADGIWVGAPKPVAATETVVPVGAASAAGSGPVWRPSDVAAVAPPAGPAPLPEATGLAAWAAAARGCRAEGRASPVPAMIRASTCGAGSPWPASPIVVEAASTGRAPSAAEAGATVETGACAAAEAGAAAGAIEPGTEVEEVAATPESGAVRAAVVEDAATPAAGNAVADTAVAAWADAGPVGAEGDVAATTDAGAPASGASPAVPTAPTAAAASIEPVEVPAAAPPDPTFASAWTGADTSAAPADESSRASIAGSAEVADAEPSRRVDRPESALSLALFATAFDVDLAAAFSVAAASFATCVVAVAADKFPIDWPFDREEDGQRGSAGAGEALAAEPARVPATP